MRFKVIKIWYIIVRIIYKPMKARIELKRPEESTVKVTSPPKGRSVKGKSNLFLVISTFGYQMLWYPHFAELCWVTSKLKEVLGL